MPRPPPVISAVRPSRRVGGTTSDSGVDSSFIPAQSVRPDHVGGPQGKERGETVGGDAVEQDVRQGIGVDREPQSRLHMANQEGDVVLVTHAGRAMELLGQSQDGLRHLLGLQASGQRVGSRAC